MRILSWNLFHGRSLPASAHALSGQFAAMIAAWDWDVALLQEVPPWWPALLAQAAAAEQRTALTSRNSAPALRRVLAERRPELIRSNGGGANAVLARVPIIAHSSLRLRLWPERRVAQLLRLADGTCVANFHASCRVRLAESELELLWRHALAWAAGAPLILGGDLNLRAPRSPSTEVLHLARRDVDHLLGAGVRRVGRAELLERRVKLGAHEVELSDHLPLRVAVSALASPSAHRRAPRGVGLSGVVSA
jgi:endonuclease/exonuclease/phosphatase family metal-dependent hydrolase